MMAAGVDFDHLSRLFSSAVWGGRVSPNWPVAITLASVLGFIAALGAHRDGASLPRGATGATTALAYILIVVGIAFAAWPALVTVSATSLLIAALLLVAALVAYWRAHGLERESVMMRNALLALAAIVVIGAGFVATFFAWNAMDKRRAFALGVPYTNFNWKTAHAQERGCNACHADHLAADTNRLTVGRAKPELHGIFKTSYDIPMRVEDCLICHNTKDVAGLRRQHPFPAHAFGLLRQYGRSCDSCHATLLNGKFVLYSDETRYDVLNGVKYNATPVFTQQSSETMLRDLATAAKAE